jgi:RNA polymerase sigma-70 factor (ECF subfamily)
VLKEQACRPDAPIDAEDSKLTSILLKYQEQLLAMMGPIIEARLRQMTRQSQDIDDLRQEVYLWLAEKPVQAVPRFTSLEGYVSRMSRNVGVNWVRRTQRERKSTGRVDPDRISSGEHNSPEALLIHREELAQMRRAIKQLPDLERQILSLRFIHDYSLKGIATGMNVDYNTMRRAYYRALVRLRKAMNEEQPHDEKLSANEEHAVEEW